MFIYGCILISSLIPGASTDSRLAVIKQTENFQLKTQDGKQLSLRDLRGKVLLVGFVFTTCSGTCPATTHRMASVHDQLKSEGLLKKGAHLLTITLDPERDTPDALRRYMSLYDLDPDTWTFLTGEVQRVKKVLSTWGMWTRPAANAQLDHPSRVFLVDRQGRIREIYNLGFFKPKWVVEDIKLLLAEKLK